MGLGPWGTACCSFVRFEGNRLSAIQSRRGRLKPAPMKSPAGQSRGLPSTCSQAVAEVAELRFGPFLGPARAFLQLADQVFGMSVGSLEIVVGQIAPTPLILPVSCFHLPLITSEFIGLPPGDEGKGIVRPGRLLDRFQAIGGNGFHALDALGGLDRQVTLGIALHVAGKGTTPLLVSTLISTPLTFLLAIRL